MNFDTGFDDYYLVERELAIKDLNLQYEEVQSVKWASKDEIVSLIQEGRFIDYWFAELLFEMRKQRGAHRAR
ncbi:putative Nudix hydrolase YfcD [Sporolactobacillus inulinus]|uniref:Putative Nudix hydrolase YfcD n=1 Tax=Sporolactobacillus inulinus TaxID=2078 RepID=A0A4Y1ZC88_9BACL|nr:hypothetical protein [Sporolactobacillus inulinus]GAY76630.1 putative Nudix hydrolase YfcD [Sporolactobacillus inulinus]